MNKKIFFDLDTVDSELFIGKLRSVKFECDTAYSIDLFIVPFNQEIANDFLRRFPHRKDSSDQLFLIKTIPFILFSNDNRDEKLKSLFLDLFVSVSYTDVGYYCVDGESYNKAFCIEINRGNFAL